MKYEEIQERMEKLVSQPTKHISDDVMKKVIEELTQKTPKSKEKFEAAQKVIPRGCEHMLSHKTPYPPFMDKGEGPYLIDIDGNRYVDYLNGGGPVLLGHNPPELIEKMMEVMRTKGPFHGLCDEYETLAAEKIVQHMPAVEKVRFVQSGTEADMIAIRMARVYTGKQKIVKFQAAYHGWSDQLVVDIWVPKLGRMMANGIPESVTENTVVVPQNDLEAVEQAIEDHKDKGGIAAVIIEPLGAESGTIRSRYGIPGRHGRRPGIAWRRSRSDGSRQDHGRMLPVQRSNRRQVRGDGCSESRYYVGRLRALLSCRHDRCQSAVVRCDVSHDL